MPLDVEGGRCSVPGPSWAPAGVHPDIDPHQVLSIRLLEREARRVAHHEATHVNHFTSAGTMRDC